MALEFDLLAVGNENKSGDAILIRYGDLNKGGNAQHVVLIDGGYQNNAEDIKEMLRKYYNCKNSDGKYVIDLMILSHPDSDHVGGLKVLSEDPEIEIKWLLMQKPWNVVKLNDFHDGRMTQRSLEHKVKESFQAAYDLFNNIDEQHHLSSSQDTYCLGKAKFHILGPSDELYRRKIVECPKTPDPKVSDAGKQNCYSQKEEEDFYEDREIDWNREETTSEINETSLVILFEFEGHKILLTGDAGKEGLEDAIKYATKNGIDLTDIDIIKMPHHGSRKNVNPETMDSIGSEGTRCYISCVEGDEGHHPSKRLVNMLKKKGFRVLTTSGRNLHKGYGAPKRKNYKSASPLDYFPTMEKL